MQAYRKCGQPALPKYEDVLTSDGSVFRHGLPMSGSVRALLSQSVLQHEDSAFDARNDIHDLKLFPRMTERRMTKVMPQSDCFCKVFIQTQCFCYRTRILGHFQRMCKPRSIMISFRKKKNLRLLFQPSESFTMKNPVTISLKSRSDITRFLFSFPSLRVFA